SGLGEGVNVASRMEGLNKIYGTTILVSDAVRAEAGDEFVFRRLDRVAVKGKSRAVELHELVGRRGEVDEGAVVAYEAALRHYFEGRFEAAAEILRDRDDHAPSQVLLARCRVLAGARPATWDGVYRAERK